MFMVMLAQGFSRVEMICKRFMPWNRIFHLHNGNPKARKVNACYPRMVSSGAGEPVRDRGISPFFGYCVVRSVIELRAMSGNVW